MPSSDASNMVNGKMSWREESRATENDELGRYSQGTGLKEHSYSKMGLIMFVQQNLKIAVYQ